MSFRLVSKTDGRSFGGGDGISTFGLGWGFIFSTNFDGYVVWAFIGLMVLILFTLVSLTVG
jgi:hypothetical protein